MSSQRGMFGQKVVTFKKIHMAEIKASAISEETMRVIRKSQVQSLQGLLGKDSVESDFFQAGYEIREKF